MIEIGENSNEELNVKNFIVTKWKYETHIQVELSENMKVGSSENLKKSENKKISGGAEWREREQLSPE